MLLLDEFEDRLEFEDDWLDDELDEAIDEVLLFEEEDLGIDSKSISCITPGNPFILHCFPAHKTDLTPLQHEHLDRIAAKIVRSFNKSNPITRVEIIGHAATWKGISKEEYGRRALVRAKNVRNQLLKRLKNAGFSSQITIAVGHRADKKPLVDNKVNSLTSAAQKNRALNRRVEIMLSRQTKKVYHPELGYAISVPSMSPPDLCDLPLKMICKKQIQPNNSCFPDQKDDRLPVFDTTKIPNRWICEIIALFKHPLNQQIFAFGGASGLLISRSHILTSAHVLHQKIDIGKASFFRSAIAVMILFGFSSVRPGRNEDYVKVFPFAPIIVQNRKNFFKVPKEWKSHIRGTNDEPYRFDYGIISLAGSALCSPNLMGSSNIFPKGFWGMKNSLTRVAPTIRGFRYSNLKTSNGHNAPPQVKMTGYPGEYPCNQWISSGELTGIGYGKTRPGKPYYKETARHDFLPHNMDSSKGMSGSPVWGQMNIRRRNGIREEACVLIGIQSRCGTATAITPFVWEQHLQKWMKKI